MFACSEWYRLIDTIEISLLMPKWLEFSVITHYLRHYLREISMEMLENRKKKRAFILNLLLSEEEDESVMWLFV